MQGIPLPIPQFRLVGGFFFSFYFFFRAPAGSCVSEIFSLDGVQTLKGGEKKGKSAAAGSSSSITPFLPLLEKEGFKEVSYKISSRIVPWSV